MTHVTPPGFPAIEVGAPAKGLLLHDGRLVLWATADEQFSAHAQAVAALQIPIAMVRVFFTIAADGGASLHTNNAADTAAALKVIGDHGLLRIGGPAELTQEDSEAYADLFDDGPAAPGGTQAFVVGHRGVVLDGLTLVLQSARFVVDKVEVAHMASVPGDLARRRAASARRRVALLVDPVIADWEPVIDGLRRGDPELAVVVLLARPSYQHQRFWMQRIGAGSEVRRTNALLANTTSEELLVQRILDAAADPCDPDGKWLLGVAKHPASATAAEGRAKVQQDIWTNATRHWALHQSAQGQSAGQIAHKLDVKDDTVRDWIKKYRRDAEIDTDIAFGAWLARSGLLDDGPSAPDPPVAPDR